MKTYYAYLEGYKEFMTSFKRVYPEMYVKYGNRISMPVKGSERAMIANDMNMRPATRLILTHIITEYYTPLSN